MRRHPEVDVELTAGLSEDLYQSFDAGTLDIVFAKRRTGDTRGTVAWREPIAWVAHPDIARIQTRHCRFCCIRRRALRGRGPSKRMR